MSNDGLTAKRSHRLTADAKENVAEAVKFTEVHLLLKLLPCSLQIFMGHFKHGCSQYFRKKLMNNLLTLVI